MYIVSSLFADLRSEGYVPPGYLLEGLKEMAFTLGSWTRTKDVTIYTTMLALLLRDTHDIVYTCMGHFIIHMYVCAESVVMPPSSNPV